MNAFEFVKFTRFSPVTVAQALLYGRGGEHVRSLIEGLQCQCTNDAERKMLVQVAVGNKQAFYDFYEKSAQTDISNQTSASGILEHSECGNEVSLWVDFLPWPAPSTGGSRRPPILKGSA